MSIVITCVVFQQFYECVLYDRELLFHNLCFTLDKSTSFVILSQIRLYIINSFPKNSKLYNLINQSTNLSQLLTIERPTILPSNHLKSKKQDPRKFPITKKFVKKYKKKKTPSPRCFRFAGNQSSKTELGRSPRKERKRREREREDL